MYQIDNSTAAVSQPAATAAGTAGYFTDGNPATSTPATIVPAEWLNAVMMELANVVTGAGLTLSKPTYTQVRDAIKRLVQSQVVLNDTGAANAYTATNSPALVSGTWVNGVTQQIKVANTNTAASTYAPDGLATIPIYGLGLQPLQGGEMFAGGTAILMKQTIAGVNSGNPIAVLLECAGGAQQVAPATQSQHAPQMGQVAGVVGSARNLAMSVTAASATATLTADEIIVETALGGVRYCLPSFSKTINLATTGAGGMDTGSAPTSGYVALYAIYNPTTGASALLARNATSAVQPNVYGGANMPSGYTASALVGLWGTNGSGQFRPGYQTDREVFFNFISVLSGGTATSFTSFSLAAAIPPGSRKWGGCLYAQPGNVNNGAYVAADANGTGNQSINSPVSGQGVTAPVSLPVITSQTAFYLCNVAGSSTTLTINRYEF